jgi:site-specific DNA-methyltransferase (adenine-specific)
MLEIYNEDCVQGAADYLADKSIDLLICDPPFNIGESRFGQMYNRLESNVLAGYVEAPADYFGWSCQWLGQAHRVLKDNGSFYLVSGWSHLPEVLNAVREVGFQTINHIIWRYNFGVFTKRKYVTSHYHILFLAKPGAKIKFNTECRFSIQARGPQREALNYRDREDVWTINREYYPGRLKNSNKLPDELVRKMIQYSSDPGDVVCDFFMGNFTTAYVGLAENRHVRGFEINKNAYDLHCGRLAEVSLRGAA